MKQTLEIPTYIKYVKVSNARQPKYYEKGKKTPKLPQRYKDMKKYAWKKYPTPSKPNRQLLVDKSTGVRMIANSRSVGTPKLLKINSQAIYNQQIGKHYRGLIVKSIKTSFKDFVKSLDVVKEEDFPIKITIEVHDVILETGSLLWDVGNRAWIYSKVFEDCLTNNSIIPDDNILFVSGAPAPKFIPVDKDEDRKLMFIFEKDNDPRLDHKEYKQLRKKEYDKWILKK